MAPEPASVLAIVVRPAFHADNTGSNPVGDTLRSAARSRRCVAAAARRVRGSGAGATPGILAARVGRESVCTAACRWLGATCA